MKYIQQLSRQLALDYCCTPADILDQGNHFTEYRSLEGRRRFEDQDNCALKITAVNRKLIFTGKRRSQNSAAKIRNLPRRMVYGCRKLPGTGSHLKTIRLPVKTAHPFSCRRQRVLQKKRGLRSEHMTVGRSCSLQGTTGLTRHSALTKITRYAGSGSDFRRKDHRHGGGKRRQSFVLADRDQCGKEAECRHIASTLVTILKEEIEKLGKVPYYGTSMSNLASQRAAVNAGFRVAWVELLAEAKI